MIPNINQFYKITVKHSGQVADSYGSTTDAGAHIVQWPWDGGDQERWMFVPLNNNYYAIVCKYSGQVMDSYGSTMDAGAHIVQWPWDGGNQEQWYITDLGNGYNSLRLKLNGLALDSYGSTMDAGAHLVQWPWNNAENQKWKLEPVESFTLPSIQTYPLLPPPVYNDINDVLPDATPSVVTNYTLAPSIAVEDPWYNTTEQMQTGNEYYLYVREQHWQRVASHVLAPGESFSYTQTSGMTETDQTTVTNTVSHSIGADVGFSFGPLTAGLSYQYTQELSVQESHTTELLQEQIRTNTISNPYDYPVAWSQYILISTYYVQRRDGSIVNDSWTVVDPDSTYSSYYPKDSILIEKQVDPVLVTAQQAVYNLFADANHSKLKLDTTDYMIDQAAHLVEQLSDEDFAYEKMHLFNLVRCAKQISTKRNLLHYGDFASPNWRNSQDGWQASYNVTVLSDNPAFKGSYANMPGANARNGNITPTYLYQKVDESRLKPYTRYLVRGFVESSKDLELFVTRYGKEVHSKINIPTNICDRTYGTPNSCRMAQVADDTMSNDPCQYPYPTMPPTNGLCEDKQHFVFHIDVGEIHPRADLGIEVGFRISSPSGMAQLSNIEVIEANPLTGEALARVKKREKKWKQEMEQQCVQTEKAVSAATQAVNALFTDAQKNRLTATTTMQDILNAEAKVKNIPYVYNPYFEEIPGMNNTIFRALQSDVYTASNLYRQRNVIRNGDFSSGLSNWHATAGANVQERDGKPHVLVISQWDANVSQDVCVQPGRGYVLRVKARKEGSGKGYVTLTDCTAENTETMTFTSDERNVSPQTKVPSRPSTESSICDTVSRYNESFGIVPNYNNGVSYPSETLGTESCSCGCGTCGNTVHTPSTSYQAKTYSSAPSMPNVTGSSASYITKTIEVFPETDRMRIEIGETEGSFLVESIELICMED